MECPTCGGQSLSAGDEGMLVCDDCADRFPGYRDEELDDAFVGTAVSNRASQASQASQVRERIAAAEREAKEEEAAPRESLPNEEMLFCDAVLNVTKGVAKALVDIGIFPDRIYGPLLHILTHWVRGRNAIVPIPGAKLSRGRKVEHKKFNKRFHCAHVLSFIALAGLYVRSPTLPRDLCRLVAQGKVPFFRAAKLFLADEMYGIESVRSALSTCVVPPVTYINYGMLLHCSGEHAWPPLRHFFNGKAHVYEISAVASVPLGHMQITLCRIVRHLGLPDAFGERVLRYIDLRKEARRELDACNAPQRRKGYRKKHAWGAKRSSDAFSWNVSSAHDCSEYPTDRTLQVDVVNTMRICYGKCDSALCEALYSLETPNESHEACVAKLEAEWEEAVRHMRKWVISGGGIDAGLAIWGTLSGPALANLRGRGLKRYLEFVETTEADDDIPLFLRHYQRLFQSIAKRPALVDRQPSSIQRLRQKSNDWNWSDSHVRAKRTFAGVGEGIANSMSEGKRMVDDESKLDRKPLLPVIHKGFEIDQRGTFYPWKEPVEIGLAWTIMRHFFAGSPTGFIPDGARGSNSLEATNLVKTADKSLTMVVDYINVQLGGAVHRGKKMKMEEKEEYVVVDNNTIF